MRGAPAFLVMNGPSLREHDLNLLNRRGIYVATINNGCGVVRPNLWAAIDPAHRFMAQCWLDPAIEKWTTAIRRKEHIWHKQDGKFQRMPIKVGDCPNVHHFQIEYDFDPDTFFEGEKFQWGNPGKGRLDALGLAGAASTMFPIFRLLVDKGFKTINVMGATFKMKCEDPYYFQETRKPGMVSKANESFRKNNKRFAALNEVMKRMGVQVWNVTEDSALDAFERRSYEEAVEEATAVAGADIEYGDWYARLDKSTGERHV